MVIFCIYIFKYFVLLFINKIVIVIVLGFTLSHDFLFLSKASDGVGSHSANVRVSVQDVNNNAPVFVKKSYGASVQENEAIGILIFYNNNS